MKIFYINATGDSGSTGSICAEMVEFLEKNGHEGKILYGNGLSKNLNSVKIASKVSVKLHAALGRVTGLAGYFSFCSTKKIVNMIKKERPDIVHLHNLHGNFVHITRLLQFLKKNNIPTVLTLHDCFFFTGKCTHYSMVNCDKWKTECGNCPQLKKDIPSYFFDATKKMLSDKREVFQDFIGLHVIAVSDWIKNQAEKSILKGNKIERIYNWVDIDVFKPLDLKEQNEEFVVLVASAKWGAEMPKYKDLLKLVDLLPENVKIKMVGSVEKGLFIPDKIQSVSYVSTPQEMASHYNSADVYLHLSREDSFGKVIVEAMACGTPVVVYNATACPELVGSKCGYVVDCGDLNAVQEAIEEIQKNGKGYYQQSCIEHGKEFSKNKLLENTLSLYQKMI